MFDISLLFNHLYCLRAAAAEGDLAPAKQTTTYNNNNSIDQIRITLTATTILTHIQAHNNNSK